MAEQIQRQQNNSNRINTFLATTTTTTAPPATVSTTSTDTLELENNEAIIKPFTEYYDIQNDPGNIKFAVASLLNCPFRVNMKNAIAEASIYNKDFYIHPKILALNELHNQLKASLVFGQYNYVEISPALADNTDASHCKINPPFHALRGPFNAPTARILSEIYRWQYIKSKKDIMVRAYNPNVQRLSKAWSRRRKNFLAKDYSAKSINYIASVFNAQSEKPELLYTNTTVYLRHLKPIEI